MELQKKKKIGKNKTDFKWQSEKSYQTEKSKINYTNKKN